MTRNCGNCGWPAGTGLLISGGEPTENASVKIFEKTHGLHFCKFHIYLFLSVFIKTTAHVYGGIKTLKHNVGTTLRPAHHGCKNLTQTSKTRYLKRTQLVELLGSRFAYLLLFRTAKNQTQRNRRAKWCEVHIRTVARKSSIGVLHLRRGMWYSENLIKSPLICSVLYFNLRAENH